MEETILTKSQRIALEVITGTPLVNQFYLAGGTALALHLGHRYSDDFDFFTDTMFRPEDILHLLKNKGKIKVDQQDPRTLNIHFNTIKVSFFHYDYRILSPFITTENNLRLASIPDITAMKISAICNRGSKKDFIDLYTICQKCFPLQTAIEYFNKKIKPIKYDRYHIVKSLQYFDDAEQQAMPKMITKITWKTVKKFFEEEVKLIFSKE